MGILLYIVFFLLYIILLLDLPIKLLYIVILLLYIVFYYVNKFVKSKICHFSCQFKLP